LNEVRSRLGRDLPLKKVEVGLLVDDAEMSDAP
jgi:hypothetical protein